MAMPSGNVVISDKMQFLSGGAGGGGENHHHRQWFPDERDGFISWLRGEFAASNAIIDSLCHHLQCIGEPGEYDFVFGCIQQRRCNWNHVLHMQHYFSIAEVMHALQQVTWRKQQQQQHHFDQSHVAEKGLKKSASYYRQSHKVENLRENNSKSGSVPHSRDANSLDSLIPSDVKSEKGEEKEEKGEELKQRTDVRTAEDENSIHNEGEGKEGVNGISDSGEDCKKMQCQNSLSIQCGNLEPDMKKNGSNQPHLKGSFKNVVPKNTEDTVSNQDEKHKLVPIPKTFKAVEVCDGKEVNVVEGLNLYEELFDISEISGLVLLANEMRAAGRRGEFQGQTYVSLKRPMKGHGREMIQLGLPVVDGPSDDERGAGTSKERTVEAIPRVLQDVIENLVCLQVMTVKPDSCIIDFFNEGDHSHPHICPPWYGRPFCKMSLTECDVVFGKVIGTDHPGDYRGSLKLSLAAGSLLVMQGTCADFAKHAISSLRKQRILVTFTKFLPRKHQATDTSRLSPSTPTSVAQASPWGSLLSRSSSLPWHSAGPKHYAVVPTTGVVSAPPLQPHHLPPPNGIQPVFVTPMAPAVPYPTPVPLPPATTPWTTVPPRHSAARLPAPGTGVFIPPSGSHSPPPQQPGTAVVAETKVLVEDSPVETENVAEKLNFKSSCSPKCKLDEKGQVQDCNGNVNGIGGGKLASEEEQKRNVKCKGAAIAKPAAASK